MPFSAPRKSGSSNPQQKCRLQLLTTLSAIHFIHFTTQPFGHSASHELALICGKIKCNLSFVCVRLRVCLCVWSRNVPLILNKKSKIPNLLAQRPFNFSLKQKRPCACFAFPYSLRDTVARSMRHAIVAQCQRQFYIAHLVSRALNSKTFTFKCSSGSSQRCVCVCVCVWCFGVAKRCF